MSETPHADDVIQQWVQGDLSAEDADEIEDLDGETIQVKFLTEDGWVILTYSLVSDLSYRPSSTTQSGLETFDIMEVEQ